MSQWTPCKRLDFISRLRRLGFDGPFSGTRHQFMVYKQCRMAITSNSEYSIPQLLMLIRETEEITNREITVDVWDSLQMTARQFEKVLIGFSAG